MAPALRTCALLLVLLLLAACNGATDDPADTAAADPPAAEDDEAGADEPADGEAADGEAAASGTSVGVGSTDLGDVVVDGQGRTLYVFDPDAQGESTCYDDCAASWPPLVTDGEPTAGDGAEAGLLGTTEREDGSLQVTYDGWPLYHWAGDSAPGDVNGQGVGDVWWVLAPDGAPIRDAEAADAAGSTASGGGLDY